MIDVGAQVGSYRILKKIGEGGMGMVFVAEHLRLGRKVALKVLRPEYAVRPEAVTRFFNEARAVNRIGHENIVEVTDDGTEASGEAYFVMELLQGESLAERLKKERAFGLDRVLHIVTQMADALSASHRAGIIHRDLKPDNVFLISRGGDPDYVKILDFGIAKLFGSEGASPAAMTQSGAVMGTPYYMSPEQCAGKQSAIDQHTDIYALGVILYQLLTGEVPFRSEGWGEIFVMHMQSPFPSVTEKVPGLSPQFERVLNRAVEKKAENRWASMDAFRDALIPFFPPESIYTLRSGFFKSRPADEGNLETLLPASPSRPSHPASGAGPAGPSSSALSSPAQAVAPPSTVSLMAGQVAPVSLPRPARSPALYAVLGVVATLAVVFGLRERLFVQSSGPAPAAPEVRSAAVPPPPAAPPAETPKAPAVPAPAVPAAPPAAAEAPLVLPGPAATAEAGGDPDPAVAAALDGAPAPAAARKKAVVRAPLARPVLRHPVAPPAREAKKPRRAVSPSLRTLQVLPVE